MSLEKYSIEKRIGKGSYGEVFLAKHKKDKRVYVVKKVTLLKASERERKAAELEAKLLSQLRHPNIVSYRESFQGEVGFLYIVMNYCEGGDLYTRLKAQKSTFLDENQIVEWFVQIAMALQYMHEKHILHRDLKTQNIFLTRSKIIKVGDLGIAKVLESSSDMATTLIGTPYYMSPELFSNKPYNHKSDVWALGCCLYEMCTLKHAFNAKDMSALVYKILKGKTPPLPKQYSGDLCTIIRNMLDQDPDKRPSVSRLLRHPYIKKQIAKFLEGTKNRQKRKTSTSSERNNVGIPSPRIEYSESNLQSSIATVSGVDCVIPDSTKPPKNPSDPLSHNKGDSREHIERSHSETDVGRVSVDSSSSSASSSGPSEKEQTEICVPNENGVVNRKKEKEREKEAIRKQMEKRRKKSAGIKICEERTPVNKEKEVKTRIEPAADVKPLRQVRSAGSSRTPMTEGKAASQQRRLPRPPVSAAKINVNEAAPISKSPKARRRYKITSRSQSIEDKKQEHCDDEDKSTASIDSDISLSSVSESSSSQPSGLSARERRRLKQKATVSPLPADSFNAPHLPSPKGIIANVREKKMNDRSCKVVPTRSERHDCPIIPLDCVDGPPRLVKQQIESQSSGSESNGSDLEEISIDEASAQPRRRRGNSEVTSLISALDTTLKLGDQSADRASPEVQDDDQATDDIHVGIPFPSGASPSTSGRLRDRIERLRLECVRGIGEDMLLRAYAIIDSVAEDEVENELVKYMGREDFEKFGGPIWQLKFCEDFRIS